MKGAGRDMCSNLLYVSLTDRLEMPEDVRVCGCFLSLNLPPKLTHVVQNLKFKKKVEHVLSAISSRGVDDRQAMLIQTLWAPWKGICELSIFLINSLSCE